MVRLREALARQLKKQNVLFLKSENLKLKYRFLVIFKIRSALVVPSMF